MLKVLWSQFMESIVAQQAQGKQKHREQLQTLSKHFNRAIAALQAHKTVLKTALNVNSPIMERMVQQLRLADRTTPVKKHAIRTPNAELRAFGDHRRPLKELAETIDSHGQ